MIPETAEHKRFGSTRSRLLLVAAVSSLALALGASAAQAAPSAWWSMTSRMVPENLAPGGEATIFLQASDIGDETTAGPINVSDTLPEHVTVQSVEFLSTSAANGTEDLAAAHDPFFGEPVEHCSVSGQHVSCQTGSSNPFYEGLEPEWSEPPLKELLEEAIDVPPLIPFGYLEMKIRVKAEPGAATGPATARVQGGGGSTIATTQPLKVTSEPASFGVESFQLIPEEEGGSPDTQAGSHPFQLTNVLTLNQGPDTLNPPATARHLRFTLPAGFLGNTTALDRCDDLQFRHVVEGGSVDLCPQNTAVGVVNLTVNETQETDFTVPIFNLVPKHGEPARFGFEVIGIPVTLDTSVRTGGDYGVTVDVNNITELANFISSTVTLWGVPGSPSHTESRGWGCIAGGKYAKEAEVSCDHSKESSPAPFLTMPSSCAGPWRPTVEGQSWPKKASPESEPTSSSFTAVPYQLIDGFGRELAITGCDKLPFEPTLEVAPDGEAASTPSGLTVDVKVPQEVNNNGGGRASSSVKDIAVTFPEGMTVNPAGADGLQACSIPEIGFTGFNVYNPITEPGSRTALFTPTLGSPFCPKASKIGTVTLKVPVIKNPLKGALYLATQESNPFGSLIATYIVAEDEESGVIVKLPGEVTLNPTTGQISTTFKNSPQAPLEEAEIHLFGGAQAPFSTPSHCGTYPTTATFTPWSGGPAVTSSSSFNITGGPTPGSACPPATLPFTPTLAAGTTNVSAGSFSPLVTTIGREDGNQNISRVQLHMPSGLAGILTGVPLCPEAQANAGSCPQASLIGHTTVSVGLGNEPFTVVGGEVFLTAGYEGAPFGLSIVNPAVAGPFNLGKVIVRARIDIDPRTAALTVTTGEIPHILKGIPLQIKHVNVTIDRQNFTFNPTNCNPLAITGAIGSVEGATAPLSTPFQVTNCAALKFTPTVAVATKAKASKANGASLNFKIAYPKGALGSQSWFNEAKFDIPKQLPARLTTIQKACLAATFEANKAACPAASKIGTAIVKTPVLPVPLTGPVYFVSYGGAKFPDAVLVLDGYGVHIELHGETFINGKTGVTSATFRNTPDVPFESIEVNIPTGPFSEFGANLPAKAKYNLCGQKLVMPTLFKAQNGLEVHQNTPVGVTGCAKKKLTRKQKLAAALKACHKKRRARRASCALQARRRYGTVKKPKAHSNGHR